MQVHFFGGKLLFAADGWGGASKTLITKVQTLQDRATKTIIGKSADRLSSSQRTQKTRVA